jgi:hypothetical protein
VKKLLASKMRYLVIDTKMQQLVIIIIKILGEVGLRIGWADKNGPLAQFEHLRFEA